MSSKRQSLFNRREFLLQTSLAAGAGITATAFAATNRGVSIIVDSNDPVASAAPAAWAVMELEQSLKAKGISVQRHGAISEAPHKDFRIVVAGSDNSLARTILADAKIPRVPESFGIVPGRAARTEALLACGPDAHGVVYAALELADRVNFAEDPFAALHLREAIIEEPVNHVRSVNRAFVSVVEDRPWFQHREMWPSYLTMLAGQRFNRFSLTLGLGYDYPNPVLDSYLYFAYPFLVSVPGYNVRAVPLPDHERDLNLEMLRYISDEVAARGMDFQLGLWNHGYEWPKGSHANYMIEGLTPQTHAPYCRDALVAVLKACPKINGVTIRIHGESGIPEQDFAFWQTLFSGLTRLNRTIELNLHAKGMSERMIEMALATGLPVTLSPKYWAEHMGLPYQPSSIRKMEMPPLGKSKAGFFDLSEGSRRFLRYSYGDLIKKDRRYKIFFRIWPGTQRVLLWGNPAMAAGDASAMNFCGCDGVDWFEPLSFKGRHGSGLPGGRCAYEDESLKPKYDWQKFLYTYRVWGRNIYNPSTDPDGWRRLMRHQLQAAAPPAAEALAHASPILRLVTTDRDPSAANNIYWPEIYTNMPIADPLLNHIYFDTLPPRVFNNVSPLDPELFSQINEFTKERLRGKNSGKYSPLEVATWLEDLAAAASRHLADAKTRSKSAAAPEFRRLAVDVAIQCGLGRFFAWKIRSGVFFSIYEQTGNHSALQQAVSAYHRARTHWVEAADAAKGVYRTDITYGIAPNLRGTWSDRLPAMDKDIAAMEKLSSSRIEQPASKGSELPLFEDTLMRDVLLPARPLRFVCRHTPPKQFEPGQAVPLILAVESKEGPTSNISVSLHYRQVDQGLYYQQAEMQFDGSQYSAAIPADYLKSPYPLQYFFIVRSGPAAASIYPGFDARLSNQPYLTLRQA